jgi:hypothetical protein
MSNKEPQNIEVNLGHWTFLVGHSAVQTVWVILPMFIRRPQSTEGRVQPGEPRANAVSGREKNGIKRCSAFIGFSEDARVQREFSQCRVLDKRFDRPDFLFRRKR